MVAEKVNLCARKNANLWPQNTDLCALNAPFCQQNSTKGTQNADLCRHDANLCVQNGCLYPEMLIKCKLEGAKYPFV